MKSINGIININKPQNYTSHDCVAIVRSLTGVKRVGHTGTLDPMATGVLPICIGSSTRIMEYLDGDKKEYLCTLQLGLRTDTCDVWGKTEGEEKRVSLTAKEIRSAFDSFQGEIMQIPPKYSALKVRGRKLYEYARADKEVEIQPRKVTIYSMKVKEISANLVRFQTICSGGTYIRSICRDVGDILGVGGTMAGLVRLASGSFRIEDAVELEKLRALSGSFGEAMEGKILPTDYPLKIYEMIQLSEKDAEDFVHGRPVESMGNPFEQKEKSLKKDFIRVYYKNIFLGMAKKGNKPGELRAHKVFQRSITERQNEDI